MTVDLTRSPFPIKYRELWLPRGIKGLTGPLPTCRHDGHGLTFTGARRGTTCDGVHGDGANTGNINAGANAVDNAAAKYWTSLRFKPDINWASGDGDQYIWGKFVDATHYIILFLESATGNLIFEKNEGGALFSLAISSPDGDSIWHGGTWYHSLCSISNVAAARFKVNDADLQTDADVAAMPNGGDLIFLDFEDPGSGTGFQGVEVDIFCGIDDLSGAEETDLFKGIPPADAVHAYPLDEGRGVTAYDRGSGADDGTLDTTAIWAWGRVKHPVISTNGIDAYAQSSAGVDAGGDKTLVWVGKIKCTYDSISKYSPWILGILGGVARMRLYGSAGLVAEVFDGTTTYTLNGNTFTIDDYAIICLIWSETNAYASLNLNGLLVDSAKPALATAPGGGIARLGSRFNIANFGVDKPLMGALIEGAFTKEQLLTYSRYLDRVFNLGVVK